MKMNPDCVKQTIEELERQRSLIDSALRALRALEPLASGTAAAPKARRTNEALNSSFACEKHPGATEFSKRGQCKRCRSEFMKNYWRKKKQGQKEKSNTPKPNREPVASPARVAAAEAQEGSKFVYSQRQRCPKCGAPTRFFRPAVAKPNDNWICMDTGCELKVANYKISVDHDYQPDRGVAVAASA